MKRLFLISLSVLGLLILMPENSLRTQDLTVNYDCSQLPGPWSIIGLGEYSLSISSRILTMIDHNTSEGVCDARMVDWFNNRRLLEPIGNIPPPPNTRRYIIAVRRL